MLVYICMHIRTYLCTLKKNYKEKIKCLDAVVAMKDREEISDEECTMLKGFLINTDRDCSDPVPTKLDKMKLALAYYKGKTEVIASTSVLITCVQYVYPH